MLYRHIHIHNTNISGNIVNNNDNFNERTNTFFIKISLTLYSRKGDVGCVWEMSWRQGETAILTPNSSDHSSTSFSSCLGYSNVGYWGPKSLCLPLALNSASCPQLTQAVCVPVILLFNVHLLPLFSRLFTQVRLLIDGSIEGQYVIPTTLAIML